MQSTNDRLQRLDPLAESLGVVTLMGDQMDMIGHDDEPTRKPMVTLRAIEEKRREPLEDVFVVEDRETALDAKCEEIGEVAFAVAPDPGEAAKTAGRLGHAP